MEYNINSSFNSHISLIEELKKNSQSFIEESSKLIINTILSKNNIFGVEMVVAQVMLCIFLLSLMVNLLMIEFH